ncbi:MAG TPA: MATE family efflux transporter, partial [Bacteroidia bacterium]|nr:MATE family efflux transporter [Bacteroidia bacterium]
MFTKEYLSHHKKTASLAYPLCLSQLGQIMVGVVDTAMVGHLGTIQQAAVALANSVFMAILVFGIGVSYGITPLVAIADSHKNEKECAHLLKNGLLVNVFTGIVLFIFLYLATPLMKNLGEPTHIVSLAIPFFSVLLFSMIPLSFFFSFKQFAEGLSRTRIAMLISVAGNIVNIILNYIFIFGKCGMAPMGIMGSCWASFISRVFMAIGMFLYVFYDAYFKPYWKNFFSDEASFSMPLIRKILGIGIPTGFQFVFEVATFAIAAIMTGWIGAVPLAAHQIALSIAAITYMVASGLGAAACVRIGNQFGLKSKKNMHQVGFSAYFMVICFMLCSAILLILLRNILPIIFTNDPKVIAVSSSLLVIAAFFQLSDGIQVVGLGLLRGMKDVKIPTLITFIAYWAIGLPCSYVLAFKFGLGVQGVWYGLLLGLTASAGLLFLRFRHVLKS